MQDGTLAEGLLHTKMLVLLDHFYADYARGWLTHGSFGLVQEGASTPFRGPDGRYRHASQIESVDDVLIGGWAIPPPRYPSPSPTYPDGTDGGDASRNVTPPPPFSSLPIQQTGYPFVRQSGPFMDDTPAPPLNTSEGSQAFKRRRWFMVPYLQFMCGPLLRYDAVDEHGVWHGAALIVSKCSWIFLSLGCSFGGC